MEKVFQIGETLGGAFEIRALLGTGSMGQVYEAFDRVLRRHVAIKAAPEGVADQILRDEAVGLAMFSHPSVVAVYGVGRHRQTNYIVMERLYGTSLLNHLAHREGNRLTLDEALDISQGIADGLALVHRAAIAHRDLKPSNIMLAPGNRVVLLDFGLVIPEDDTTASRVPCGTPQYMAPEVVSQTAEPGDRRLIDLYSLGVIMFEMLTGTAPFAAVEPEVAMERQLHEPVPHLGDLLPDLPPLLDELVYALMSKSPTARPQTAEAVAFSLRQVRSQARVGGDDPVSVLIVDDEPYATRLLELYTRSAAPNALIRTAADGLEGLRAARESPPDLLLLDLHMPGMNGLELAMSLRATHLADRCRIVALSARAEEHDIRLLHDLGITEFIPKTAQTRGQVEAIIHDLVRERTKRWWGHAPAA